MTDAKHKAKPEIKKRDPQKRTPAGIFDNLRPLPHPMEEILGIADRPTEIKDQPDQPTTTVISSLAQNELSSVSLAQKKLSSKQAKVKTDLVHFELSSKETKLIFAQERGFKTLNYLEDELMPQLEPAEQIVLRRLYRLSFGFNRNMTDSVSLKKLAEKCNIGDATVKRALNGLRNRGLIVVHSDKSRDPNGGNRYSVLPKLIMSLAQIEPSSEQAKPKISHIIDHEDLNNTNDHHQSATMTTYQSITGNKPTKKDQEVYSQLKDIPVEVIEQGIRIISQRAPQKPGSLAYFVKGIVDLYNAGEAAPTASKPQLRAIIERLRTAHAGSKYSIADLSEDVKRACAREGLLFDHELFNELIG